MRWVLPGARFALARATELATASAGEVARVRLLDRLIIFSVAPGVEHAKQRDVAYVAKR